MDGPLSRKNRKYTVEEDTLIIQFFLNKKNAKNLGGSKIWQEMESDPKVSSSLTSRVALKSRP